MVDTLHNLGRTVFLGRYIPEEAARDRHEQGGGNTLAGDVAYAEDQLFVPDIEIV